MNAQEQLQEDLKTAMRNGDRLRVGVIRMAIAALKNAQIAMVKEAFDAAGEDTSIDRTQRLSDQAMLDTLAKEVRRRHEAAELFRKGGRAELAEREEAEAGILEGYLPRMMTADELRPLVSEVISEIGATSLAQISKVMPVLMQRFKGRADGRVINQVARELLSQGQ
jgi:uncharacterized protein YqeY